MTLITNSSPFYKNILSTEFYQSKDTLSLAKALLGKEILHETAEGILSGIIVETEAYLQNDKACHAYKGLTARNAPMFGTAGTSYIYFIYGVHHCFNIVSGPDGLGEAILIRALEPKTGLDQMKKNRSKESLKDLCSGPGKLVQAMAIDKNFNGHSLTEPPLFLKQTMKEFEIIETTRIGIGMGKDEHLPYRFYIKGNKFISKP